MKRRPYTPQIFTALCAVMAIFMAAPAPASSQTITIWTIEDLQKIGNDASYPLDGDYALGADIDAAATLSWNSGAGFDPIGTSAAPFSGSLDGQGYTIANLYINRPASSNVGLFGYVAGEPAIIRNITLIAAEIHAKGFAGGLVGYKDNCLIYNCSSTGSVSAQDDYAGGLVGWSQAGTPITNCYSTSSVSGQLGIGGLMGKNNNCLIKNCYSTGAVTANDYAGGLVGWSQNGAQIDNCYSTSSVTGQNGIGGLVGYSEDTSIIKSYSAGSVSVTENRTGSLVGGLIGWSTVTTASDCFWDSTASGQTLSAGGTAKSTEDMKKKSTFTGAGWDFTTVWGIVDTTTYPFFRGANDVPQANPDTYSVETNQVFTKAAPGVLANDLDPDGDQLYAILVTGPSHGTLSLVWTGAFTYTPETAFTGTDNFTYKASSGDDNTTAVIVTLLVGNSAPIAGNDSYTVYRNMQLYESRPGVLSNDFDSNGDKLSAIVAVPPEHGTLNLHPSGWFIYRPDVNFVGTDTFSYYADDGEFSSPPAVVTIEVTRYCPAIALYGETSPEVATLRRYRDEVLALSATGRALTKCYYRMAPQLEDLLKNSKGLQSMTKGIINGTLPGIRERLQQKR